MSDLTIYRDAVIEIKNAIIQSRYRSSLSANVEQLTLYYNVGCYVSENTRTGKWGTDAIESISNQLQRELPGVRGFSATNIRNMRIFFEQWTAEFEPSHNLIDDQIHQLPTDEFDVADAHLEFHHLPSDELNKYGALPNNFTLTIPDTKNASKTG